MVDTPSTVVIAVVGGGTIVGLTMQDGSGFEAFQSVQRANGAPVDSSNPGPVIDAAAILNLGSIIAGQVVEIATLGSISAALAGSIGTDRSANAPASPGEASTYLWNGVTLNLLKTIAANPNRHSVEVNNTTGSQILVVVDSGVGDANPSLFPLEPGAGQFRQGGDFTPPRELGRVRVYGTSGAYCYAREN